MALLVATEFQNDLIFPQIAKRVNPQCLRFGSSRMKM